MSKKLIFKSIVLLMLVFFQISFISLGGEESKNLEIKNITTVRSPEPVINVMLSEKVGYWTSPKSYIKIEPKVDFKVNKSENKLIIKGNFDDSKSYTITFLKGLKGKDGDGQVLYKDVIETVTFNPLEGKLEFSDNGAILPSINNKKIYFRSRNVKEVDIEVNRVLKNNITEFLRYKNLENTSEKIGNNLKENTSEVVYKKTVKIDNIKDEWIQNELNLEKIIGENDLYIINILISENGLAYDYRNSNDNEYEYYDGGYYSGKDYFRLKNGNLEKILLTSDISIIATSEEKLRIKILDILTNRPLEEVEVELISKNNQIIEKGITDKEGNINFENKSTPFYIVAKKGDRFGFLKLESPLSSDGLDVTGIYPKNDGVKAFIYTERDIYRPGDDIYLSIIVRDSKNEITENHPIIYTVYNPRGEQFSDGVVDTKSKNGMYSHGIKTKATSMTGVWRIIYKIGNQSFYKNISVENIVPATIRNKIEAPEKISHITGEPFVIKIKSNQLVGPPASGKRYTVDVVFTEDDIKFQQYKNYSFKKSSDYLKNSEVYSVEGNLDENGEVEVTVPEEFINNLNFKSINPVANIIVKVFEENGRAVTTTTSSNIEIFSNYLGLEKSKSHWVKNNEALNLKVVTPDLGGTKLVKGRELVYRIYKNTSSWWWDYSSYSSFIRSLKENKKSELVVEKRFVSTEKPYLITDKIDVDGYVYIEVEDVNTGQVASVNMYVSNWGSSDNDIKSSIEHIEIRKDKDFYKVGEKSKISFTGTKNAKALILVEEKGKIIKEILKDIKEGNNEEIIEITDSMAPNAYVHVLMLQDYNTKNNDRPFRIYGITPIKVLDENSKLDINIEVPKSVMPEEEFTIKVKNGLNKKMNYTVAVVDIGLLEISGFKTPDPWNYFHQKVSSTIKIFDNYSEIIDKPYGKIHQVLTVGGDNMVMESVKSDERLKKQGLEDVKRFVPVVLFSGVKESDDNGNGEVTFKMPKYMGAVRVMVIGDSEKAFGSSEEEIIVKAPIVTTSYIPRTLKTGDIFVTPINVIALDEDINDVKIEFIFNDESQMKKINLKKGEKQTLYFKQKVPNEVGKGSIIVKTISNKYSYDEKIEIGINSDSMPVITSKDLVLNPGEKAEIIQEREYVRGSVDAKIRITDKPVLGIDERLKYLIRYPYGCLEQTVSSIFPQLYLEKLMSNNIYSGREVQNNIILGIERLEKFQLPNGGFSYWAGEDKVNTWATNYAGHFLIAAKNSGYYVPDGMYNKWLNYIENTLSYDSIREDDLYSQYLLALGEKPNKNKLNYLYSSQLEDLSDMGKLYLAGAFAIIGETTIAEEIFKKVQIPDEKAPYSYYSSYGSQYLKNLGIYLDTHMLIYKKPNMDVHNLIVNNLRGKKWYSTQSIGYSLIPLSKITNNSSNSKDIEAEIKIDGILETKKEVGKIDYILDPADGIIQITNKSSMPVYLNYLWDGILLNKEVDDYSKNFKIKRTFYRNNGEILDPTRLKSGEEFWIQVNVSGTTRFSIENVALSQILPSGWEIENLRVTKSVIPDWIELKRTKNIDYEDFRDDRAFYFFTFDNEYSSEDINIFLKVRAITKGSFMFPGTSVEAMYNNEFSAYLKGFKVEVE